MQARPQRPYRNLAEFCAKRAWPGRRAVPGETFYPCLTCLGRTWVYDPHDPPCPVEGNKMRNTLQCEACGGTGRSSREACSAAYRKVIAEWKEKATRYDRLAALRKEALSRLKPDHVVALKELGL